MNLTSEQRHTLVRVLRWGRTRGWKRDDLGFWRNADECAVAFNAARSELFLAWNPPASGTMRQCCVLPVSGLNVALDLLAVFGFIPLSLSPRYAALSRRVARMVRQCASCAMYPGPQIGEEFDGPDTFAAAGQVFADTVSGTVSAEEAARVLSTLAHEGLIISTRYHDDVIGELIRDDSPIAYLPTEMAQ